MLQGLELLASQLDAIERDLAAGWSLPYAWMGDPDLHAFEQAALIERSWQVAGLERDLAKPGSRLLCRIGRVPVVVVRGEEMEIRAFVNACRHRAYPVAEESGCSRLLVCRYHGWSYHLDGRLQRAPGSDGERGFDPDALRLKEISAVAWRGIVLVNVDRKARSFAATYPTLESIAAGAGSDIRPYRHHSRSEFEIGCDWKLLYDNTAECYHCPTMHADSLNQMYDSDGFHAGGWQDGVRYARSSLKDGNRQHHSIQLFPGIMLFQDPVMALLGRFHPASPGRSRLVVDYFAAPDADTREVETFIAWWSQTLAEDKVLLEAQTVGITSGQLDRGRLIRSREDSLPGVQLQILAGYRAALSEQA